MRETLTTMQEIEVDQTREVLRVDTIHLWCSCIDNCNFRAISCHNLSRRVHKCVGVRFSRLPPAPSLARCTSPQTPCCKYVLARIRMELAKWSRKRIEWKWCAARWYDFPLGLTHPMERWIVIEIGGLHLICVSFLHSE
ncbi:hypothetical protein M404DRAFT_443320 [Pisolithus tinctorius Marx 270]|uniref:Uncharacterized protein n=1 Tax=Pisolithus tinctorius Marx 270 TaxID=870435 RepID=A0A0C3MXZ5_PISTI|nr:hypothetical protein M404DRAFT_443320 [Pisolithus tinctorius Marx 270]